MKICYLVPGALGRHPDGVSEARRRSEYLAAHVGAGAIAELRDDPEGPPSVESPEDERRAAASVVQLIGRLTGFDAIVLGCFGDPGLEAARRATPIPLVGPAEAACHEAAGQAPRIGILTVVDDVVPLLRSLVDSYGLGSALAGVEAVNVPVRQLRRRRAEVLDRLEVRGVRLREAGAGALVLGCMTMGFLDLAADLRRRIDLPVVNPVAAGLRRARELAGSTPGQATADAGPAT